jgi:hypothetical protein
MLATPEIDESTQSLEHLDFTVACSLVVQLTEERRTQRCENPAAWVMTCRTCGTVTFICDPHVAYLRAIAAVTPLGLTHAACGVRGKTLEEIVTITPIGAGR